jgi:16S rRNA processing protein RimM
VSAETRRIVVVGRVSGVHGVRGWLKIRSFTEPRDNIAGFATWILCRNGREQTVVVEELRGQGGAMLAKLRGVDAREQAAEWIGADISVERAQLPRCAPGEYYWVDLEGLEVQTPQGEVLGRVDRLLATGSNDVLVLSGDGERLIPFVMGDVIRSIDLEKGLIVADWSADF